MIGHFSSAVLIKEMALCDEVKHCVVNAWYCGRNEHRATKRYLKNIRANGVDFCTNQSEAMLMSWNNARKVTYFLQDHANFSSIVWGYEGVSRKMNKEN